MSMDPGSECPGYEFNFAVTAGFYAQLTAVLAGFAFTAIITFLAFRRKKVTRDADDGIVLAFLAGFLAMVLSSINYSVLATEAFPGARGRIATEELILAPPFGLAFVILMHGLTLMVIRGTRSRAPSTLASVMTVVALPSITIFYAINSMAETTTARLAVTDPAQLCQGATILGQPELTLILLAVPVTTAGFLLATFVRPWRRLLYPIRSLPAIIVVMASVLSAFLMGYVINQPQNYLFSEQVASGSVIGIFAVICLCSLILAAEVAAQRDSQNAPQTDDDNAS